MSHFVKDHLERNYASVMSGDLEARRKYIGNIPHAGRHVERAMLTLCSRNSGLVGFVLGLELPEGATYAGAGSVHTVIESEGRIKKIHRASEALHSNRRYELARKLTLEHSILANTLGNMVLRQSTEVVNHPLKPGKQAVVSTQPKIDFTDTGIFNAYSSEINCGALEVVKQQYTGVDSALLELVEGSTKLFNETGMLVDVSGQNNIVIEGTGQDAELVCMDGLPIAAPNQGDIVRIMGQVTQLSKLL